MKHEALTSFANPMESAVLNPMKVMIFLGPNSSAADIGAITQPLQTVNQIIGKRLIDWSYTAIDEQSRNLTCGIKFECVGKCTEAHKDTLIFITGKNFSAQHDRDIANWVRRHYRKGNRFVLLGDTVFAIARAGLLNDRRVAVHWESIDLFREMFPQITAIDQIYSIDSKFSASTCSDATTDLVISMIQNDIMPDIARKVQQRLNRPNLRDPDTPQNIPLSQQFGTRNQAFISIVEYILGNVDQDLVVNELSEKFNISRRQLERLFSHRTGMTPLKFIQDVRLRKAAKLLQSTNMSILEIAFACGFSSGATFRVSFKRKYRVNPSQFSRALP